MKFLKCEVCGKIVAVVNDCECPTKCCGEAMKEMIFESRPTFEEIVKGLHELECYLSKY